ncbi:hypothetical protein KAI46_01400 [bacterium]|nr:hypothetical protein [bacterium]
MMLPDDNLKRRGTDCRFYYKAIKKKIDQLPAMNSLELEAKALALLRGMLRRHFSFSMSEAFRSRDVHFSRYNWKIEGRIFYLKMPNSLFGKKRRKWLEENSINIDFRNPEANDKLQKLIDFRFPRNCNELISFNDERNYSSEPVFVFNEQIRLDLVEAVAQEKVATIDRLRPAIRRLGPEKLRHLINRIFSDVETFRTVDKEIADDFNLSPSTFSRFAGSDWLKRSTGMPDLWQNTATVVMSYPPFREAAESSGFFEAINRK